MKKILHINTNDLRGGAARIPYRLMNEQNALGFESTMLVGFKEMSSGHTYPFDSKNERREDFKEQGYQYYDLQGSFELHTNPLFQKADIVHLHNLHGDYFNPFSLSYLSHLKPIVWSLHDMHSVTGHCGYSYACDRWRIGCGACPNLQEYPSLATDRTHDNLKEKELIYRHSKLFIAPTAKWIGDIAKQGALKEQPMEVVLNGVAIDIYRPLNKKIVRQKYGIPTDRLIIGAVANGGTFGQERKGGQYVQLVVDRLIEAGYDILLVNVGGGTRGYENDNLYHVGYLSTEEEMAEVYNAFDIYLFPSTADTCPLVISEAMGCGVPIVSFDTGGIPELIQHGETGFVATHKDVDGLYEYTVQLLDSEELRIAFSVAARDYCVTHFEHKQVTMKYLDVYKDAIETFDKRKNEVLYFDLAEVPEVIKSQPAFIQSEQVKGEQLTKVIGEAPKVEIVVDGTENLTNVDAIFIERKGFEMSSGYLDTMMYKEMNTDIVASPFILKRKNGKNFFQPATAIDPANKTSKTAIGGQLYSKSFFESNKEAILSGDVIPYQSIELYNTENVSIAIDAYMKNLFKESVYVYGAGTHTVELLAESEYLQQRVIGVIDRNPHLTGTKLNDIHEVITLDSIDPDIPILISSASFENEIYDELCTKVKNPLIKLYN